MEERKSKVAWPGMAQEGGDAQGETKQDLKKLLDEFGLALEDEANNAKITIFAFPMFKEFNLLAGITSNSIFYIFSPSRGIPKLFWNDFRDQINQPNIQNLMATIRIQLDWDSLSYIQLESSIIRKNASERATYLRSLAQKLVQNTISPIEKESRVVRFNPIFKGREFYMQNELCFVLMPFREPFYRLYENHVKPTLTKMGFKVIKADDMFTSTAIIEDIWKYINESRLIVADVTGKNPNVFYELGIAHTVGKDFIILTQDKDDVPFDLRHMRYFSYVDNENGWEDLRKSLENAVNAIINK